jgi:hypothetical protein
VEELLSGAGMSGFLGVLDPPDVTTYLEKLVDEVDPLATNPCGDSGDPQGDGDIVGSDAQVGPAPFASSEMPARVASVVQKVEALTELLNATAKNCCGEPKMKD